MKIWPRFWTIMYSLTVIPLLLSGCKKDQKENTAQLALNSATIEKSIASTNKRPLSKEFKEYWYAGDAEITSYHLEQARYGEIREGKAVLIYVTEPFLPEVQVKADQSNTNNIPVLKLNATKKYLTGIYPYSIMSSTFYPVNKNGHALKTSLSVQEWCGHVYAQINNREAFEFTSHSYFEGEADQLINIEKAVMENELWNKIRISPEDLPIGEFQIVPSLEFLRVKHIEPKVFKASAVLNTSDGITTYTLDYVDMQRKLTINFTTDFPHTIESWTEEFTSGFGRNAKLLISKGTKLKSLKTAYWGQNSNSYVTLRDSLNL
ncbi:MAG: septum formation inhibitor Maf [Bacteroidota bacterium]